MLKGLDLFCGLGGWSDGLAEEGFEMVGIEIEPKIAALYKHKVIVADVRDLNPYDFQGYDLVVGSPPCRDFTRLCGYWKLRWTRNPQNPERGLELVNAFLRFVEEAMPRYWLMENVLGLTDYFDMPPRVKAKISRTMKRGFWGNFPPFLIPKDLKKPKLESYGGPLKSWERAKIPLPVARALGRAVREAITIAAG